MADDRHYVPGSFYRIDDQSGFKVRAERTRKQWNNIIVRLESWEPRQPQDFVKGVPDYQMVPEPRPRQTNTFLGPLVSSIIAPTPTGSILIEIENTGRMYAGDVINVILDNTDSFRTTINKVNSNTELILGAPLPWSVSFGNEVSDWSAVSPPNINSSGSGGDD